jgi:hypothetical protein
LTGKASRLLFVCKEVFFGTRIILSKQRTQ